MEWWVIGWFQRQPFYSLLFPTPQISAPGLFELLPTVPGDGDGDGDDSWLPMMKDEAFLRVSSASLSILLTSSSQDGISWINPMT